MMLFMAGFIVSAFGCEGVCQATRTAGRGNFFLLNDVSSDCWRLCNHYVYPGL